MRPQRMVVPDLVHSYSESHQNNGGPKGLNFRGKRMKVIQDGPFAVVNTHNNLSIAKCFRYLNLLSSNLRHVNISIQQRSPSSAVKITSKLGKSQCEVQPRIDQKGDAKQCAKKMKHLDCTFTVLQTSQSNAQKCQKQRLRNRVHQIQG